MARAADSADPGDPVDSGHKTGVQQTGVEHAGIQQIRVHGVAGTLARLILRTDPKPEPRRDDRSTQWFTADPNPMPEGYTSLEAYSWTDLTSARIGQGVRALLAPLLFVNVAGWMLPRSTRGWTGALSAACVRVAGLTSTGFLAIGLTWALYLAPATACRAVVFRDRSRPPLDEVTCRFEPWPTRLSELWIASILAALPLLGVLRAWSKHRAFHTTPQQPDRPPQNDVRAAGLDWSDRVTQVERNGSKAMLAATHWLFCVLVILASYAVSRGFWTKKFTDANPLIVILVLGLLGCVALASWLDPGTGHDDDRGVQSTSDRVIATLVVTGLASVITWSLLPTFKSDHYRASDVEVTLVQHFELVNLIAGYAVMSLLCLVALLAVNRWAGLQSLALLGLSMLVAGAMSAGIAFAAVWLFDLRPLRFEIGGNAHLAYALVASLGTFVVVVLGLLIHERNQLGPDKRPALALLVHRRLRWLVVALIGSQLFGWTLGLLSVDRVVYRAFDEQTTWLILMAVAAILIIEILVLVLQDWTLKRTPVASIAILTLAVTVVLALKWSPSSTTALEQRIEIVGLLLPLVFFGYTLYRWAADADSRRGLGAASDIATFWPRTYHPLVPKPYSAAAIDDLGANLRARLVASKDAKIMLAGHSQGSLLSTLAVLQLDPTNEGAGTSPTASESGDATTRGRLALLTYGSPIGHLYREGFPATFGDNAPLVSCVERRVSDWHNLHRATDPIGAPIRPGTPGTPGASFPLPKNTVVAEENHHTNDGHSKYEITVEFRTAERELRDALNNLSH